MSQTPPATQNYLLAHKRFGVATVTIVDDTDDDWITVKIVAGQLKAFSPNLSWYPGDTKDLHRSNCSFQPIPIPPKT